MKKITLYISLFFAILNTAFAQQPGTLDSSFGENGIVINQKSDWSLGFGDLLITNDDKILTAVNDYLIRYEPDGNIDSSYGEEGYAATDPDFVCNSFLLPPDKKILLAGYVYRKTGQGVNFAFTRFLPDGSLDSTFGLNGLVVNELDSVYFVHGATLLPDGRIMVCGVHYYDPINGKTYPFLSRFLEDGSMDNSFGDNGIMLYKELEFYTLSQMLFHPNGKLYVSGSRGVASPGLSFLLSRFTAEGSIDSSFGDNGLVVTNIDVNDEYVNDMLLQPDGKIVTVGPARTYGFPQKKSYVSS